MRVARTVAVGLAALLVGCGQAPAPTTPARTVAEYFGERSPDEVRADEQAQHDHYEEHVQSCMQDAGHEYRRQPFRPPAGLPPGGSSHPAFAASHGYGISTSVLVDEAPPPDPNEELLAGRTDEERAAFVEDRAACEAAAYHDVFAAMEQAEAALAEPFAELEALVLADPRMAGPLDRWSRCLAAGGHGPYAGPADPRDEIRADLDAIVGAGGEHELTAADRAALVALQDRERAVALADRACWERHVRTTELDVRRDVEPAFLARHLDTLAVLRPAHEAPHGH